MDRRTFLGVSSAAAAAAAARNSLGLHGSAAAGEQPNFLFLIADDLMFRTIAAINNPEVRTPHLDALVHRGCHFTHCFHQGSWTGAVCVASRTMLNTGLTAFRAQKAIPDNQAAAVPTWGQTLRAAGYDTYLTGKWHLDAVSLQRSFSEFGPVAPGYLPSTPDMYNRPAPGNTWNPAGRDLKGHWLHDALWRNQPSDNRIQHSSELYADAAVEHLTSVVPRKQVPFFMYVGRTTRDRRRRNSSTCTRRTRSRCRPTTCRSTLSTRATTKRAMNCSRPFRARRMTCRCTAANTTRSSATWTRRSAAFSPRCRRPARLTTPTSSSPPTTAWPWASTA